MAYFDLARSCLQGHWTTLINGYWSPGYPVLLTLPMFFLRSMLQEILLAHLLNCALLAGALAAFEFLLNGVMNSAAFLQFDMANSAALSTQDMRLAGYVLFFWCSIFATPSNLDSPDALVLAIVLLAGGMVIRVANGRNGWRWFAALGAVLGAGYLVKAILFPVTFVFIAVAACAAGSLRHALRGLIFAILFFGLVAGPFIFALSRSKGRLTYGDVGAIAYAEYVDGVRPYTHWQGGPAGSGTPVHPTRKLMDVPPVYEFATPIAGGTFPPSNDQSYWYEGVRPHFEWRGQLMALWHTLDDYYDVFVRLGPVAAAFLILFLFAGDFSAYGRRFLRLYFLWVPAVACFALYGIVHVELRFLPGFIVLLWAAAFAALRVPRSELGKTVERVATMAMVILLGAQMAWSMSRSSIRGVVNRNGFTAPAVVDRLRSLDVRAGDRVACIGCPPGDGYWAHLAGVTIVEEIPYGDFPSYLAASPEQKARAIRALGQTGAKAIVARDLPPGFDRRGWEQIADTPYSVFVLRTSRGSASN